MKKVALHNLGCKVNAYETEAMQELLEKHGYEIVPFQEGADVYIINTCTVTNMADRKSRQMLHRARKMNPDSIVVACGCYVQARKDDIPDGIDIVIGNNKKQNIVEILENYEKEKNPDAQAGTPAKQEKAAETYQEILDINHEKAYEDLHLSTAAEHTRAYIKVQDGCNQFCSYCIIPYARGPIRSLPVKEAVAQTKELCRQGFREIVLTGIEISAYGADLMPPLTLCDLVEQVCLAAGNTRISLGSLKPTIVDESFCRCLSKLDNLCQHFHLSLQSGCTETLRRMNRKYTAEDILRAVSLLRAFFVEPNITADVIVGFPLETDEEFRESLKTLEQCRLGDAHIFPYSVRSGTAAERMPGRVANAVKKKRAAQCADLCGRMRDAFLDRQIGTSQTVLLEEGKNGLTGGYTDRYLYVVLENPGRLTPGEVVSVRITGRHGAELIGTL